MKRQFTTILAFGLLSQAAFALDASNFKVSGALDLGTDSYFNTEESKLHNSFYSTFDLLFSVQFDKKWSAEAAITADGDNTAPEFAYDGAFVQYTLADDIFFRAGDMTYAEGAFKFYLYDDTGDFAAGMKDISLRGVEANFKGLTLAIGLTEYTSPSGSNVDENGGEDPSISAYDIHIAYDLVLGGQTFRPFFNYMSYQTATENQLKTGVVAKLVFGPAEIQAVYGLYGFALGEDEPALTHTFAFEPTIQLGKVSILASVYYAMLDEDAPYEAEEIPEYFFGYIEPGYAFTDKFSIGIPVEYHTNSLDEDTDLETFVVGPSLYYNVTETLALSAYANVTLPIGDDYGDNDDAIFGFGTEVEFSF